MSSPTSVSEFLQPHIEESLSNAPKIDPNEDATSKTTRTRTTNEQDLLLEDLTSDSLGQLCQYVDVDTALWLLNALNVPEKAIVHGLLWRRLGFSLDYTNAGTIEKELYLRLHWNRQLIRIKRGLSLPQRCLRFIPVLPQLDLVADLTDPPPVDWDCDSFLLTTSTTGEMLFLDPFSGELSVWKNLLEHAVAPCTWNAPSILPNKAPHLPIPTRRQILIDEDAYFDFNLSQYRLDPSYGVDADAEFDVSYNGIDTKFVLDDKGHVTGTLVAVGRTISSEIQKVTEIVVWTRSTGEEEYDDRRVCRLTRPFHIMDLCANQKCLYVNHATDTRRTLAVGSFQIHCYPLVDTASDDSFPSSTKVVDVGAPVTTLAVCAQTSDLIVATSTGELLLYHECELQWRQSIAKSHPKMHAAHPAPVWSLHCPRGLSIHQSGFLTLQKSRHDGLRLTLWQSCEEGWCPVAAVELPLSSRRIPQIHFDGRRLLVFGQDHIGVILLVYQLRYSGDDFGDAPVVGQQGSGGVTNFCEPCRIRYANRIRHVALGGLEYFESVHMTVNDRYVVLNTKAGQHLHDTGHPADGLLVFDHNEA